MLSETENLNDLLLEKEVIKQILNKGIEIDILCRSWRRFFIKRTDRFGRKIRTIKIFAPVLNTMDEAADVKLDIAVDLEGFNTSPVRTKNTLIKDNAMLMARVIAIYYLNSAWKIRIFGNFMTNYLANRIDNRLMSDAFLGLEVLEDAKSFINSTVSAAGTRRTTQPKAEEIEAKPAKTRVRQSETIPPTELGE